MIKPVATAISVAVSIAVAASMGSGTAHAAAATFVPCHGTSGVLCATLSVPLDASGAAAGTVPLAVEELPAKGTPRGAMMLVAGGPGQASAVAFDLSTLGSRWQALFPGYTLVAYDPRGTGNSGFLPCSIGGGSSFELAAQVAACGDALGPNRVYYTTAENADDVEAVRQALGVDKLAVWGTSYGTKVALAYALAHPDHVERLLLDSVVTPTGPDPLSLDSLQGIPVALRSLCGTAACRAIAPDLAAEVATLANRAATAPISGRVRTTSGRLESVALDGETLLGMVVGSDLDPGLRAELPSAITGALAGRPQALLRLATFTGSAGFSSFRTATDVSFSEGLFLATMCNDGRFPWQPNAALADRQQALNGAVAALPAGATGPFGTWATGLGSATYCLTWPSPAGNAPLAAGPFPDVPVLALSGSLDMRTPTANATAVVSQFPQGHVLVVPGIGHSVLTLDPSGCAASTVRTWLSGGAVPARCAPVRPYVGAVGKIPATVAAAVPARGVSGLRGRTLTAVESTVQDAFAAWITNGGGTLAGLSGGKISGSPFSPVLSWYSDIPGLDVSGGMRIQKAKKGAVYQVSGSITVAGARAAHGVVTFTLGGGVKVRWSRSS